MIQINLQSYSQYLQLFCAITVYLCNDAACFSHHNMTSQPHPKINPCSNLNKINKLILISSAMRGCWCDILYVILKISSCNVTCLISHWSHGDHSSAVIRCNAFIFFNYMISVSAAIIHLFCVPFT